MRIAAMLVMFVLGATFAKADEKDKKLSGAWTKKAGDFELKFDFKKENTFTFTMSNGTDGCELGAKYKLEKDGTLKCEVTSFEKKGQFPVEKTVGYKFSFKFDVTDKTAKLSDLAGDDIDDQGKQQLAGEYTKK